MLKYNKGASHIPHTPGTKKKRGGGGGGGQATNLLLQQGSNLALGGCNVPVHAIHHLQQLLFGLLARDALALWGLLGSLLVVLDVIIAVDVLQVGAQSRALRGAEDGRPGSRGVGEPPAGRADTRVCAVGCLGKDAVALGDVNEQPRPLDGDGVLGGEVAGDGVLLVVARGWVVVGTRVVVGVGVSAGVHAAVRLVVAWTVTTVCTDGRVGLEVAVLRPKIRRNSPEEMGGGGGGGGKVDTYGFLQFVGTIQLELRAKKRCRAMDDNG